MKTLLLKEDQLFLKEETMCTKSISTSDGDLLTILTDCSDDGDGEKKTLAETPGGRIQVFLKRRDSPGDQNCTIENYENIFL